MELSAGLEKTSGLQSQSRASHTVRSCADYRFKDMHSRSQHTRQGGEKPAKKKIQKNLKQLAKELLGSHYGAELLVRGGCDWPGIKRGFIFPHHTHSNRMLITLLPSSSGGRTDVDTLFEHRSEAGGRSWEL